MKDILRSFFIFLILGSLAACDESESASEAFVPPTDVLQTASEEAFAAITPLKGVEVPMHRFEWTAQEGGRFELKNGTLVEVPPQAIVDVDNNPISGRVEMTYREFHDAADILMSGVSMRYDSAGKPHVLSSAGMLEIRVSKNGEPLFLKDGKSIEVTMASFAQGSYNLYYLNEETKAWEYTLTHAPKPNPNRKSRLSGVKPPPLPLKPEKLDRNKDLVFNYDINYGSFPELAIYNGIQWKYADIVDNKSKDPTQDSWITQERWQAVTLSKKNGRKGLYYLNLKNSVRTATVIVSPVLEDLDYEEAMIYYLHTKKERDNLMAKLAEEQDRIAQQAAVLRPCPVSKLGFFNWDKALNTNNFSKMAVNFRLENETDGVPSKIQQVFLILPEKNAVLSYHRDEWADFRYLPGTPIQIVTFLKEEGFAMVDAKVFAEAVGNPTGSFVMKPVSQQPQSTSALRSLLNGG